MWRTDDTLLRVHGDGGEEEKVARRDDSVNQQPS